MSRWGWLGARDIFRAGATRRGADSSKPSKRKKKLIHISALKQSNFLTRADVGRGALMTIRSVTQENVAKQGAPEELRWCLHFDEAEKPMVLNSTNGQIIASIVKNEDTDHWIGHKIVCYDDPNVSFGGKLVGGIRVRAPRQPAAAPAVRPAAAAPQAPRQPEPQPDAPPANWQPSDNDGGVGDDSVPF